jgi:hypothetical protein
MFTKQVSRPMDIPDPPSWPRMRSRSSNSRKDLVTGLIRVLAPYILGERRKTRADPVLRSNRVASECNR